MDLAALLVLAAKETDPELRALLTAEAKRQAKRQRREGSFLPRLVPTGLTDDVWPCQASPAVP